MFAEQYGFEVHIGTTGKCIDQEDKVMTAGSEFAYCVSDLALMEAAVAGQWTAASNWAVRRNNEQ